MPVCPDQRHIESGYVRACCRGPGDASRPRQDATSEIPVHAPAPLPQADRSPPTHNPVGLARITARSQPAGHAAIVGPPSRADLPAEEGPAGERKSKYLPSSGTPEEQAGCPGSAACPGPSAFAEPRSTMINTN